MKNESIVEEPEVPYISWDLSSALKQISDGLGTNILRLIQVRLDISKAELSSLLLVSPRTLDRRRKESTLPPDESERSFRIARLTDLAAMILGDMESAANWFKKPNYALGNQTPLELMRTEPGAKLVERTLRQIEHGISV